MNLELVELAEKINDLSKVEKEEFYLYFFGTMEEILSFLPKQHIQILLDKYIPENHGYWELREKDKEIESLEEEVWDLETKIEKLEKQIKLLETKHDAASVLWTELKTK